MISDSGEITIRAARMEDVPILVDLSSQLNYLSTDSEISNRLGFFTDNPDHIILVAVSSSGNVIGWAHGPFRKLLTVPDHVELGGRRLPQPGNWYHAVDRN